MDCVIAVLGIIIWELGGLVLIRRGLHTQGITGEAGLGQAAKPDQLHSHHKKVCNCLSAPIPINWLKINVSDAAHAVWIKRITPDALQPVYAQLSN